MFLSPAPDQVAAGGGFVLIDEQILGSDGLLTFASIPGTYAGLLLLGRAKSSEATAARDLSVRVGSGSIDTGSSYAWSSWNSAVANSNSNSDTRASAGRIVSNAAAAAYFSPIRIDFHGYADTGEQRSWLSHTAAFISGTENGQSMGHGVWTNTADAIDIIQLGATTAHGNLEVGSWARLYGLPAS